MPEDRLRVEELPKLIDPGDLGRMVAQWAKDHAHRERARLEILFEGGQYVVRAFEEAWGAREIAAPPRHQPAPPAEPPKSDRGASPT